VVEGIGPHKSLLPDACVLFNFAATGCLTDIVAALGISWAIAKAVEREIVPQVADPLVPRVTEPLSIDVARLCAGGLLKVLECNTHEEAAQFVALVEPGPDHLDDGEAMTFAIAIQRGFAVATDDRKARRVLAKIAPQLPVYGTPSLLHRWAQLAQPEPLELARMLNAIQQRGHFVPPSSDPLAVWWQSAVTAQVQARESTAPEIAVTRNPHLFDLLETEA
jgi:predicted nucleic acid-binding protein